MKVSSLGKIAVGGGFILYFFTYFVLGGFGMGVYHGAEVATNESIDITDERQDLQLERENVTAQIYSDHMTQFEKSTVQLSVGWLVGSFYDSVLFGLEWGYLNPSSGLVVSLVAMIAALLSWIAGVYDIINMAKRWWL